MSEIILKFENIKLGYSGEPVLPVVNLEVDQGDFLGIVGPNGAGKTTLLKALLNLLQPLEGNVTRNMNITCGYVPQKGELDEHFPLTARDIVTMARVPFSPLFGNDKKSKKIVQESLERLEITDLADRPFRELSGGQKQRTLIARALAAEPGILVLDEPTNGMDIKSEKAIMDILKNLNEKGMTIIMVTHLLNLVANYAKKVMLINNILEIGSMEEILNPENLSETYSIPVGVVEKQNKKYIFVE
ncbi:MAG: metal ABC transporter ATP-binding protein [Vulcanimicrobiota bacterium]